MNEHHSPLEELPVLIQNWMLFHEVVAQLSFAMGIWEWKTIVSVVHSVHGF